MRRFIISASHSCPAGLPLAQNRVPLRSSHPIYIYIYILLWISNNHIYIYKFIYNSIYTHTILYIYIYIILYIRYFVKPAPGATLELCSAPYQAFATGDLSSDHQWTRRTACHHGAANQSSQCSRIFNNIYIYKYLCPLIKQGNIN